jgi:hypothetical protein
MGCDFPAFLSSTIVFLRATSLAGARPHAVPAATPGILRHAALEGLLPASPTALLRPIGVGIGSFFFPTSTEYATASRLSLRTAFASAFLIVASFSP